ncbi:taste receptor type 2 member 143-like [Leptodactylus fuscus]|uniref:taste receptor type 2 member 143-like n=1 Tax=Leptodactylus fuscus TaxID=238119 RepID=UPI003F4E85B5
MAAISSYTRANHTLNQTSYCWFVDMDMRYVLGLLLVPLLAMAGVVTSSFIVFTIGKDFFRKQNIDTRHKILAALSFSNFCFSLLFPFPISVRIFSFDVYTSLNDVVHALTLYSSTSSAWLTSCLCFFYFIKIADFRSRCLSLMKMKIDPIMTWAVLVVEGLCLCGSLLKTMVFSPTVDISTNNSGPETFSWSFFLVLYISNLVSFLVVMVSMAFAIMSLRQHIQHIATHMGTSASVHLDAHRGAVRTLRHLMGFYLLFCLAMTLSHFMDFLWHCHKDVIIFMIFFLFSPLQSILIIDSDLKLKEAQRKLCPTCVTMCAPS